MKRILFYYDNYCGEKSKGGTEVATFRIAKALKDTGSAEVFNAFLRKRNPESDDIYTDTVKLSKSRPAFVSDLSEFINSHRIDYVVNMGRFFRHKKLMKAAASAGRETKVLFMHHFAPGSETKKGTWKSGCHLLKMQPLNYLYWLRSSVYPLLKLPRILKLPKAYREVYENSNATILLSAGYIQPFKELANIREEDKFAVIPNIYDKESSIPSPLKEKSVLVLSRMDEIQKRISLALQIWKNIEQKPALDDWHLHIVGAGHDFKAIKRFASKLGLKNITFHGWQSSRPFLEKAAILMSTSEYEGLPLSIIEAQSYGCIPVAFNSYASLKDVVSDEKNGIIIENFGDTDEFSRRLADLMRNTELRHRLSEEARKNSTVFSPAAIAMQWNALLDKL